MGGLPKNDAALLLTMLFLVVIGEGVLWRHRKDEKFARWKFRALLYGIGALTGAWIHFEPRIGFRLDLILYAFYVFLVVALVGLYFYIKHKIGGFNRALIQAQELHNFGKTSEAIAVLQGQRQRAAKFDRNTESILLAEMARMSIENNDVESAERFLDEAEVASPLNQGVYGNRADLLSRAGNHDAACDALRRGLEKLPTSVWLHTELVEHLADAGRNDQARAELTRTIELLDKEKHLDVANSEEWREVRIAPLVERLNVVDSPDNLP